MLVGTPAVVLNLLCIAVLGLLLMAGVVSILWRAIRPYMVRLPLITQRVILWGMAGLPWLVVVCTVLCFSPHTETAAHHSLSIHHYHLQQFTPYRWYVLMVIPAVIGLAVGFAGKLQQLVIHRRKARLLLALTQPLEQAVHRLPTDEITAFTTGFITRTTFVSEGLLTQLEPHEVAVVLAHEHAHAHHADPLKRWVYSLLTLIFPPAVRTSLNDDYQLAQEMRADCAAVTAQSDSFTVASVMVKVARLLKAAEPQPVGSAAFIQSEQLERRITSLVMPRHDCPSLRFIRRLALPIVALVVASLVDGLHHQLEFFLLH